MVAPADPQVMAIARKRKAEITALSILSQGSDVGGGLFRV